MTSLSSPRNLRRGLLHLAMALLLLLTQQLALRHALEHDSDPDHHPAHSQCLSCLACHALDHATSGTPSVSLRVGVSVEERPRHTPHTVCGAAVVARRARGPPVFLA